MEQGFYFNETCDPVDLTLCSQYYVDPCNCTKFYQCAQNQLRMFSLSCVPGTIYNHNNLVCDYPDDVICHPLRPWERCNVTESRMKQLRMMCGTNITNGNNPSNSDRNTNGIDVQMIQTILPSIAGVLVCAILIGFVINRYKRSGSVPVINPETTERPYDILDLSRMTSERNSEIHISDPYNSYDPYNTYHRFDSSTPEYCPSETQRFNPAYGVDPTAPTVCLSTIPHIYDVQSVNTLGETVSSEGSSYLTVRENDSTPRSSETPEQSDDDREFTDREDQNGNKPEGEIVSSEDGSYLIVGESDSTPYPSAMPRVYGAVDPTQPSVSESSPTMSQGNKTTTQYVTPRDEDSDGSYISVRQPAPTVCLSTIPHVYGVQSVNALGETVSSEGSSYLTVRENDSTPRSSGTPEQSDDDREFTEKGDQNGNKPEGEIVSSEDGSYPIVGESVSTPDPSAMPRVYDANREHIDRAIPRRNTHQEEIASSEGSSYESVLPFDPTTRPSVMAHPSDADREFPDRTVSSEDSAFVVVEESGPLFHPYISGHGPWHHKVIFNINEHYFP